MTHDCPTGKHPQPHMNCYYGHGCRCRPCTDAVVADSRRRRRDRAYGRPRSRLTDPVHARVAIAALIDLGATHEWISEQTRLNAPNLRAIRAGRRSRVRTATVAQLQHLWRDVGAGRAIPPRYADAQRRKVARERRRQYRSVAA